jgi:hypothetical protein
MSLKWNTPRVAFSLYGLTATSTVLESFPVTSGADPLNNTVSASREDMSLEGPVAVRVYNDDAATASAVITLQESADGSSWGTVTNGTVTVVPGGTALFACHPKKAYKQLIGTGGGKVAIWLEMGSNDKNLYQQPLNQP